MNNDADDFSSHRLPILKLDPKHHGIETNHPHYALSEILTQNL